MEDNLSIKNSFLSKILIYFKNTIIWNIGRSIKQRVYSCLKSDDEELSKVKQSFILKSQKVIARKDIFYIQSRMDIDPLGGWHNPEFIKKYGGFFPSFNKGDSKRKIVSACSSDSVRKDLLILLLRSIIQNDVEGEIVELGVYRGETAKLIHHYCPERILNLYDTFDGFNQRDIDKENNQIKNSESIKQFKDTSEDIVLNYISPQNNNVKIFKGYFPDSLSNSCRDKSLSFVHIDVDLYQPTISGLNLFYPNLSRKGIIIVHDYNAWPGVRKAVDEFLIDKKEIAIPMPDKSGSAIIVKN